MFFVIVKMAAIITVPLRLVGTVLTGIARGLASCVRVTFTSCGRLCGRAARAGGSAAKGVGKLAKKTGKRGRKGGKKGGKKGKKKKKEQPDDMDWDLEGLLEEPEEEEESEDEESGGSWWFGASADAPLPPLMLKMERGSAPAPIISTA